MDEKLTKSLTDLIDETLMELDELRKSRFAAAEVKIEGPGDGIAGKPSDGKLDASKAEDDKDEDDMDKGEGKNSEADPGPVHHGVGSDKPAGPRELTGGGNVRTSDGKNSEADLGETHKAEDDKEGDPADSDKTKRDLKALLGGEMKKSIEETESLMKSFVEERVKPLEDKLSTILDLVNKIADQPVAPKGATARGPAPLAKSEGEGLEPLSKTQVANKLFELKKSGTRVDSLDIAKAEMGQDLQQLLRNTRFRNQRRKRK